MSDNSFESKVIFQHKDNFREFVVSITKAGLIVQNLKSGVGRCMRQNHPQFKSWIDSFNDLMDRDEGLVLCRAFLN